MIPISQEWLKPFARKYIWWKTPEEAVAMPERVIAQVMNIGDYADIQALASEVGGCDTSRSPDARTSRSVQ